MAGIDENLVVNIKLETEEFDRKLKEVKSDIERFRTPDGSPPWAFAVLVSMLGAFLFVFAVYPVMVELGKDAMFAGLFTFVWMVSHGLTTIGRR